jgi:hypothetical protein
LGAAGWDAGVPADFEGAALGAGPPPALTGPGEFLSYISTISFVMSTVFEAYRTGVCGELTSSISV